MKKVFLTALLALCIGMVANAANKNEGQYLLHHVSAPFPMEPIKEYVFPDKRFV